MARKPLRKHGEALGSKNQYFRSAFTPKWEKKTKKPILLSVLDPPNHFHRAGYKKRAPYSARPRRFTFHPPLRRPARTPTGQACLGNYFKPKLPHEMSIHVSLHIAAPLGKQCNFYAMSLNIDVIWQLYPIAPLLHYHTYKMYVGGDCPVIQACCNILFSQSLIMNARMVTLAFLFWAAVI